MNKGNFKYGVFQFRSGLVISQAAVIATFAEAITISKIKFDTYRCCNDDRFANMPLGNDEMEL